MTDGQAKIQPPPQFTFGGNAGPSAPEVRTKHGEPALAATGPASCTCSALWRAVDEAERQEWRAMLYCGRHRRAGHALFVCAAALVLSLVGHVWRSL